MSTRPNVFAYPVPAMGATPARAVAESLERYAYVALWGLVFALSWEDSVPLFGGFAISRWLGLAAFGLAVMSVALRPQTAVPPKCITGCLRSRGGPP